jgi:hypothetical protein
MGCASEAETICDATQCDNGVVQFVEGAKMKGPENRYKREKETKERR